MQTKFGLSNFLRHGVALTAVLGVSAALAGAQTTASAPTLNFQAPSLQTTAAEPTFSSSVTDEAPLVETASVTPHVDFANAMLVQYGGRRTGKPRYRGGNTTQDGAEKYTVFFGGGFTAPVGTQSNYLKDSYAFQIGFGRNFDKHTSLNAQFDWDNLGLQNGAVNAYTNSAFLDPTNSLYGVQGSSHIWSFTLNPQYNIYSGEGLGAYVVAGGGFYHKAANFYVQAIEQGYDGYGYPVEYAANETIQNYSSNSPGVNGGFGLTYKFSRFANEKFYAEVRVVHTFNNYKPGADGSTESSAQLLAYQGYNFFPQNSQETTYFPVKFGIRF